MSKNKMLCPDCGVEMNHHADKVDYNVQDASKIDPAFGGIVEEAYTCPMCGRTHTRPQEN